MSLASQDLAEARAARHEREHAELESRHDVEYAMFELGFYDRETADAVLVANRKGHAGATSRETGVRVVVSYVPGRYAVTRQF